MADGRVEETVQTLASPPKLDIQLSAKPFGKPAHRSERHSLEVGPFETRHELPRDPDALGEHGLSQPLADPQGPDRAGEVGFRIST